MAPITCSLPISIDGKKLSFNALMKSMLPITLIEFSIFHSKCICNYHISIFPSKEFLTRQVPTETLIISKKMSSNTPSNFIGIIQQHFIIRMVVIIEEFEFPIRNSQSLLQYLVLYVNKININSMNINGVTCCRNKMNMANGFCLFGSFSHTDALQEMVSVYADMKASEIVI